MATPNDVPMSTTRGVPFLPAKLHLREEKEPVRWQRTADKDDRWRKRKHRGQ